MKKFLICIIMSLISHTMLYSQSRVDSTITDSVELVYVGSIQEPSIMKHKSTTYFIFTNDQVQKINNDQQLMIVMANLIRKFNIEGNISVRVLSNLESQVLILEENVKIKDLLISIQDSTVASLEDKIKNLESKSENYDNIVGNLNEQNDNLEKEIKKEKLKSILSLSGSAILIVLMLFILI